MQNLINDLSEKEAHDALTSAVCKDAKTHEDVCVGLVYVILTDQQNAARVSLSLQHWKKNIIFTH